MKEKSEAVIGQLCKDWETTPYKICIQQAFGKVIQKKVQTLEQQEAERERQKQLQEKLTQ